MVSGWGEIQNGANNQLPKGQNQENGLNENTHCIEKGHEWNENRYLMNIMTICLATLMQCVGPVVRKSDKKLQIRQYAVPHVTETHQLVLVISYSFNLFHLQQMLFPWYYKFYSLFEKRISNTSCGRNAQGALTSITKSAMQWVGWSHFHIFTQPCLLEYIFQDIYR